MCQSPSSTMFHPFHRHPKVRLTPTPCYYNTLIVIQMRRFMAIQTSRLNSPLPNHQNMASQTCQCYQGHLIAATGQHLLRLICRVPRKQRRLRLGHPNNPTGHLYKIAPPPWHLAHLRAMTQSSRTLPTPPRAMVHISTKIKALHNPRDA